MFAFIMIMFINGWLHEEKANGLLRRLLSTPAGKADLIGGKMIFGTVVNFVQLAVLFGLGLAMGTSRGLGFQFNVVTFILLTLLLSATSTSLGLAFASTKINPALALIPVFAGAILGGCMFSVDILPPYLRVVSYIMPQYYAMLGYQSILLRNADIVSVLPQLGALLAFTLVFFGFSVWKFDMLES
jgi:ABC-2 type transport system permease protein